MNCSEPNNRDELRRKVIKKRLSNWDSFFSQVEEKFGSVAENDSICSSDEGTIWTDPKYLSVHEEHSKVRQALRSDYGINEDSEISGNETDVELQQELGIDENAYLTDTNTSVNVSSNEDVISRKRQKINNEPAKDKREGCLSPVNKIQAPKNVVKGPGQKPGFIFENGMKLKTPCEKEISTTKPKGNQEIKRPKKGNNRETKSSSDFILRSGKVFKEPKNLSKTDDIHRKPKGVEETPTVNGTKVNEEGSASTCTETRSELDMNRNQCISRESIVDLCKQYDLWKLHKKRKSGRFGSVYIVSSLDEEPSDANRYVPELPPVTNKPFLFRKRFSLKKARF